MSKSLTSSKLIASVKRRAQIPTNQNTFKNEDFLALANEEMQLGLVPSILQLHQDYLLWYEDVSITDGKSNYRIPYRATGNKLKNVFYVDTNGNLYELTRIGDDDLADYNGPYSASFIRAFRIQNNEVIIQPNVDGYVGGYLRFFYFIRPNDLVMDEEGGVITGINRTTGVINVASLPKKFSVGQKFDFIQSESPHVHIEIDLTSTGINTTQKSITFNPSDIPTDLVVGDYVCLAQETIVPQVPTDLHVVLAHRTATRCLEALGDTQGLQNANAKLQELELKTGNVIDNRVEGAPLKVKNRHGTLRSGLLARRGSR